MLERINQGPRCELCHSPFSGVSGRVMRWIGRGPWQRNPRVCRPCGSWLANRGAEGAELELTLLFADVRGSTQLAAGMTPSEYAGVIRRFFRAGTDVFVHYQAVLDQLVGDEVIGLFLPGYAGADHARKAIEAACALLVATGHEPGRDPERAGHGPHGVGPIDGHGDFTAIGDSVNTTARLASAAGAGEILVSDASSAAASLDTATLEGRRLDLKGIAEPVDVRVVRSDPRFL